MVNRFFPVSFKDQYWAPLKISGIYLLVGALWIVFSDTAVEKLAPNQAILTQISIYKGWGYVLVTSVLLYWLIRRHTVKMLKTELVLRASEKKYHELLEQASDGIFIADADGHYTFVNEEACKTAGYAREELLAMHIQDLVAPEGLETAPSFLDELHDGKTSRTEHTLVRKDGARILCEISAKRLADGRIQSIVRDITERKVTEAALARSESRYRSLFENMSNGFARCQMLYEDGEPQDFIYLDVNQAFKNLTGLQDVIGRRVSEIIPGIHSANPELLEIYGRVASTGKPEKFETYLPGLGAGVWFSVSAYSPEKDFFVAIFETITERRQAEIALRENEERLRLSLQAANQGLYDLSVRTGDAIVNREYAEMLGYDPETFVETNAAWIERLHPDDREATARAYSDYINGLLPEYRVEFRQRTKGGRWKWILSLGKVVEYDADGKPLRMLGTHTDITERKQAEAEIHKLNAELEQRVLERTAQLEAANLELEAFSYSVSHDLRAPLRAIDGYMRILVEDYESVLDEEGKRVSGVICREAQRMGQLIDDLLSFSRLGRREIHPQNIDMQALVESVLGELAKQNEGRMVDFQIGMLHAATGDAALLRQVWINLLSNALKFTSGRKRAVIEVGSTGNDTETVYSVRDNGTGFDMAYTGKLFGVFQRLHNEDEFEGTGVGLAIVQRVIHRHGGRVWAEGTVGEGAAFHFALPRKRDGHG